MSTPNRLDRESFQLFLANANAVQQSGLDPHSLSAVVEIQQFIAAGDFDLDQAMQKIADCAHRLFNPSGVAIALLHGNSLVYRAGAGSSTKDVGRHVLAVLNVSSPRDSRQEILRVENTDTDTRIQAEICRQFGAKSLLMLPLCENHTLVGVLQILFNDPHEFADHEIRVCRLMIAALEEEMLRREQPAEKQQKLCLQETPMDHSSSGRETASAVPSVTSNAFAHTVEENALQEHTLTYQTLATTFRHIVAARAEHWHTQAAVIAREFNCLWTRVTTAILQILDRSAGATFSRVGFTLTAAVMLGALIWLSGAYHPSSTTQGPTLAKQPDPAQSLTTETTPVNALPVSDGTNVSVDTPHGDVRNTSAFRRVRVGPNEIDYISEDVTIRRFTTATPKPQLRTGVKEVSFGDDVTVRYFASDSAAVSRPSASPESKESTTHPASTHR